MSNVTIGVVENEMVIADTICLTLKKLGYQVFPPAYNYPAALRLLEHEQPDLWLLDINLGGQKDGIDIAALVKEKQDAPVIFLTANTDKNTIDRAKQVKPDAFLVKPFTKEELYATIEIAINNHAASANKDAPSTMMIKDGYGFEKIRFKEVLYLSSENNYVTFHLANGKKHNTRSTLQEMYETLPQPLFYKLNRSFIINTAHITRIETEKICLGELEFPITKSARDEIIQVVKSGA